MQPFYNTSPTPQSEMQNYHAHAPAFPLLGTYSREMKTDVNATMCVQMFKAALFLMAPKPRQRKCSTESQWTRKVRSPLKMQVSNIE